MAAAVVFDLDGVLLDSEQRWNEAQAWAAYLRDELAVPLDAGAISRDVVRRMQAGYRRELPLLPGAEAPRGARRPRLTALRAVMAVPRHPDV